MNLCPCGARGDPGAECFCSPQRLAAFRDKLSRALLDRFDLVVTVPRPRAGALAGPPGEGSEAVRGRVLAARERLDDRALRRVPEADGLLDRAVERLPLSGRGRARVARVARTAAALAGADRVLPEHVAEALSYRAPPELISNSFERRGRPVSHTNANRFRTTRYTNDQSKQPSLNHGTSAETSERDNSREAGASLRTLRRRRLADARPARVVSWRTVE